MAKLLSLFQASAFLPSSVLFPAFVVVPAAGSLISLVTISQILPSSWSSCSSVCSIDRIHYAKLCWPASLGSILGYVRSFVIVGVGVDMVISAEVLADVSLDCPSGSLIYFNRARGYMPFVLGA